jgi:serine/threonine-protein kinase
MWRQGTTLDNRFTLVRRLGRGTTGEVWAADDEELVRTVAVKIILPALSADPDFAVRFRAAARMMAAVDHPGVVDVYDYGEATDDGGQTLAYVVMELIAGRSLADELADGGRLTPARTMDVVAQTAAALQAAHDQGVIHRDVKPSNLVLRPDGAIVLTDFGIARPGHTGSQTGTGTVLGSASYPAPETIAGRALPASDQYALGILAYQCLTGAAPFVTDNVAAVSDAQMDAPLPPLPEEVPAEVREVVERALAKQPEERWPSAGEMGAAARAAGSAPVPPLVTHPTHSEPPPRETPPVRDRRNTLIAAAATALTLALAGTAIALSGSGDPRQPVAAGLSPSQPSSARAPSAQAGSSASGAPTRSSPAATTSAALSPDGAPPSPTTHGVAGAPLPGDSSAALGSPGANPPGTSSAPPPPTAPSSGGPTTYTGITGPSCAHSDGAGYEEVGTYTNGTHDGWYSEANGWPGDGCGSQSRFLPQTGTATDSGDHIGWVFHTGAVQQGSCAVSVYIPLPSTTAGDADLGGGARAHYEFLTGAGYSPSTAVDIDQSAHAGAWTSAGTVPISGGVVGLRLVDRGAATSASGGWAWAPHFAADAVRVACTGL